MNKKLIVILPALNESASIRAVIEQIPSTCPGISSIQVIVIDDGSTDQTAEEAELAGAEVIRHPRNRGVGAAFATGIRAAIEREADIIVNMDADGQFDPSDIPRLIQPIIEDGYEFATCTRFARKELIPKMPLIKRLGNYGMCWMVSLLTGQPKLTDVSCGFRAYSRDTALKLNLYGQFTYTQETFVDILAKGIAVCEVPLKVRGVREFGKSRVASNLFKYACRTSLILLRAVRDTRPLAFFGAIATFVLTTAVACYAFVGVWWLMTSRTTPWTSLLTAGTAALTLALSAGVTALLADQVGRGRRIQEELLYYQRLQHHSRTHHDPLLPRNQSPTDQDSSRDSRAAESSGSVPLD
ncbi:MAG: glycosyltransferase family 2 protein [Planctomycetota bacterium]|jgi:glycosyltransferase involved in cell wall biosynthesis